MYVASQTVHALLHNDDLKKKIYKNKTYTMTTAYKTKQIFKNYIENEDFIVLVCKT